MEANEVEPYLVPRPAVAGWQGRRGFEPEAFASLYRHSGGVPRKLNQLASRLFLYAVVEQLETIGGGDVEAGAAAQAPRPPPRPPPRAVAPRPAAGARAAGGGGRSPGPG